jgi:hypothetical protein
MKLRDTGLDHTYHVSRAKRELKKADTEKVAWAGNARRQLIRILPTIQKVRMQWEMTAGLELKDAEQRVLDLKAWKEDLKAFGGVLKAFEKNKAVQGNGDEEATVLDYLAGCKPLP